MEACGQWGCFEKPGEGPLVPLHSSKNLTQGVGLSFGA